MATISVAGKPFQGLQESKSDVNLLSQVGELEAQVASIKIELAKAQAEAKEAIEQRIATEANAQHRLEALELARSQEALEAKGMTSSLTSGISEARKVAAQAEAASELTNRSLKETRKSWATSLAAAHRGLGVRLLMAAFKQRVRDCLQHGMASWCCVVVNMKVDQSSQQNAGQQTGIGWLINPSVEHELAEARLLQARVKALKMTVQKGEAEQRYARRKGQLEAWGFQRWCAFKDAERFHASKLTGEAQIAQNAQMVQSALVERHIRARHFIAKLLQWQGVSLSWGMSRWSYVLDRRRVVEEMQANLLSLQLEKRTLVRLFKAMRDQLADMEREGSTNEDIVMAVQCHMLQLESIHDHSDDFRIH